MLDGYEKHVVSEYSKLNYYAVGLEVAIGGFLLSGPTITYLVNPLILKLFWILLSVSIVSGLIFIWSSIKAVEIGKALFELAKVIKNYDFVLKTKFNHIDTQNTALFKAYVETLPQDEKRYLLELFSG